MSSSSDILELKKLKKVISRKRVSKIKKKYLKAERKVIKRLYIEDEHDKLDYVVKCNFSEFKRKYFEELYLRVDELINDYLDDMQPAMKAYIYEKDRDRIFEVLALLNNIFNRNGITWALFSEYLTYRKESTYPGIVNISILQDQQGKAINILNILGEYCENNTYLINDVNIRISYGYMLNGERQQLNRNSISFCIIENQRFPVLRDEKIKK